MGECLIMRRGGETHKLPILDPNYPADASAVVVKGNTTSATFSVKISEPGNPAEYTYQWYANDTPISGATAASYTMTGLSETANYSVYCEVKNKAGVVNSRIATLEVIQQSTPTLNVSYPEDTTVEFDESITCKVEIEAHGIPETYTYQWFKDGIAVDGATDPIYTFAPYVVGTVEVYCQVTNDAGTVTSRTATITSRDVYLFLNGTFHPRLCPNGMQTSGNVWIYEGCIHSLERSPFYFNDLIDLTHVSSITLLHVGSWNANSNFAVFNTSGSEVAKVTGSGSYVYKTIDVSGLTGRYRLGFYGTGGYATGQFTFDLNHVMIHP